MKRLGSHILAGAVVLLCGCQGMYAQQEAKEQFQSALEQFGVLVNFQGGPLEGTYNKLSGVYERSETKAKAVTKRIDDVEDVGEALFKEWAKELEEYTNETLKERSEQKLRETRLRYARLIGAMRGAEMKIEPVLSAFHDQVLFLKHNLNAQAVASLQDELVSVKTNVAALIEEMEESIAEANAFIDAMDQE